MNDACRLLDKCDSSYRSMSLIPHPVHSSGQRVTRAKKGNDGKRRGRKRGRGERKDCERCLGTGSHF